MGIFEPETITLLDGWLRLVFFTAVCFNLILAIESYLDKDAFYENIIVHIFTIFGALWFTCELIYIPNEIFGNSTDEGGLINILRLPWTVSMGILCCMSMGVIHDSNLLTNDFILWARLPLIGLSLLLAVSQQLLGFETMEWDHDNNVCHGWKVKRWYERKDPQNAIELIPDSGISINLVFGLLMTVAPGLSMYAELTEFMSEDVTTNEQVTCGSVVVIDIILLIEALLFATKIKASPIHFFIVLSHLYVAAKASEEIGSGAFMTPLTGAFPVVVVEV